MYRQSLRGDERSPIWEESIAAFAHELKTFFPGEKTISQEVENDEDIKTATGKRDSNLPVFTYRIDNLAIDRSGKNIKTMRRHGIPVGKRETQAAGERIEDPQDTITKHHLIPCLTTIIVTLVGRRDDIRRFGALWVEAVEGNYLNFELVVEGSVFGVKVDLEENLTYPDLNFEGSDIVTARTQVVIHNWVGTIRREKKIRQCIVRGSIVSRVPKDAKREVLDTFSITKHMDGKRDPDHSEQ